MRSSIFLMGLLLAVPLGASAGELVAAPGPRASPRSGLNFGRAPAMDGAGTGFRRGDDDSDSSSDSDGLQVDFSRPPRWIPGLVVDGDLSGRLRWARDRPAFPGDRPGSLRVLYDATLPPGRLGFHLPAPLTQNDTFTAAAVFVIDPEGFTADPFGFFQISWGLWNTTTTGLDRTGTPLNFASDSFDLVEFSYFPNVSPDFGGPFLAPTVAGAADTANPLLPFLGAFANFAFTSTQVTLPPGEPLLALLEHDAGAGLLTITMYLIVDRQHLEPIPGGAVSTPLSQLTWREYLVDALGLTLWQDGFSGPSPSVRATLRYHSLALRHGLVDHPAQMLGH